MEKIFICPNPSHCQTFILFLMNKRKSCLHANQAYSFPLFFKSKESFSSFWVFQTINAFVQFTKLMDYHMCQVFLNIPFEASNGA